MCENEMHGEVAFAEVPLPAMNTVVPDGNRFHPDITIQTGIMLIGVSNATSDSLLDKRKRFVLKWISFTYPFLYNDC